MARKESLMTVHTEQTIWEELEHLRTKMLALEKKLDEKLGACEAWLFVKRIVYMELIILPAALLLLALVMLAA